VPFSAPPCYQVPSWQGQAPEAEQALEAYSRALGLAFQIVDDILNEIGDPARLGKPVGTDRARQKATYPRLYGLEAAYARAQQELQNALNALQPFGTVADPLRWLARSVFSPLHEGSR
jgi:geranylgeranyl diphosphate synthase type II